MDLQEDGKHDTLLEQDQQRVKAHDSGEGQAKFPLFPGQSRFRIHSPLSAEDDVKQAPAQEPQKALSQSLDATNATDTPSDSTDTLHMATDSDDDSDEEHSLINATLEANLSHTLDTAETSDVHGELYQHRTHADISDDSDCCHDEQGESEEIRGDNDNAPGETDGCVLDDVFDDDEEQHEQEQPRAPAVPDNWNDMTEAEKVTAKLFPL